MIVSIAYYTVEGLVKATYWTTSSIYRWVFPKPPDPLITDIQEHIKKTNKELEELKKILYERERKQLL